MTDSILRDQLTYYRERAAEFEQFYTREGRYDRGAQLNALFISELGDLQNFLEQQQIGGDVLELACGTGFWTRLLAPRAAAMTAVDGAPEMLAIARGRLESPNITWMQADLFSWQPATKYDVIFFGFWLSHVPEERFDAFWKSIERAAAPQTRVIFFDSRFETTSTAKDHTLKDPALGRVRRKLNSGKEFEIVKVFYHPDQLRERLAKLGWRFEIRSTPKYFLYASGARAHT